MLNIPDSEPSSATSQSKREELEIKGLVFDIKKYAIHEYFSKAVHCSVSGAIIRKAGAVSLNTACARTDVSDAVNVQRHAHSEQLCSSKTSL